MGRGDGAMPADLVTMAATLRAVPLGAPGSPLPPGAPTRGELERAAAMLDPLQRHGFLAGRLALRELVAELLVADPGAVRPAYTCPECGVGEHGVPGFVLKPDVSAPVVPAPFWPLPVAASMARAGGWALLAAEVTPRCGSAGSGAAEVGNRTTLGHGIGVDLAVVDDFRRGIPDAAYTVAERRLASAAEGAATGDPSAEAARIWARKEAILKALGTGLRGDPVAVETVGSPRIANLDTAALGLPGGFVAAMARVAPTHSPT